MFHVPNKYRSRKGHMPSDDSIGNNGFFFIPYFRGDGEFRVMASDGQGWDHVSVSVAQVGHKATRCPNWNEMCFIKDLFWDKTDCVIQFHPPESEYVNTHNFVLHLWKKQSYDFPMPDKGMV